MNHRGQGHTWPADLHNPAFEWRVALVGTALCVPGMLLGLTVCAFLGGPDHVPVALAAGGVLGAILGAAMEASP